MKIVIDIPSKWFDDMVREEFTQVDELCAIIQHSTVVNDDEWMKKADMVAKFHKRDALEDVRAEIEHELDELDAHNENCGLHKALVIIDKHLRGNINE